MLALFDKDLPSNEREAIAKELSSVPCPDKFPLAKPEFPAPLMSNDHKAKNGFFCGAKKWLLFNKMNAAGNWLQKNVNDWEDDAEYMRMKNCLQDLKVVNDLAERCIKDILDYADLAKDSQYQEDIVIVATDHRGILQDLRKQALAN